MKTETSMSNPGSTDAKLPELNRAFKKAMQAKNFAECERLKAEIDAVLNEALRSLRLRYRASHE
jgi:hypothetical protein